VLLRRHAATALNQRSGLCFLCRGSPGDRGSGEAALNLAPCLHAPRPERFSNFVASPVGDAVCSASVHAASACLSGGCQACSPTNLVCDITQRDGVRVDRSRKLEPVLGWPLSRHPQLTLTESVNPSLAHGCMEIRSRLVPSCLLPIQLKGTSATSGSLSRWKNGPTVSCDLCDSVHFAAFLVPLPAYLADENCCFVLT